MTSRSALLLALLVTTAASAIADYCPPNSELSGGMRDIMLCYMREGQWDPDHFAPYVAYMDRARGNTPQDWFFDAFLFLMYSGAPSGGAYFDGNANASDWAPLSRLSLLSRCQYRGP